MSKAGKSAYMLLFALFTIALSSSVIGAELGEYEIKSGMLFNFAHYIEWAAPDDTTVEICIAGKNRSNSSFEQLNGKIVKERKIVVKYVDLPRNINGCNMLFVNRSEQQQASSYIREATQKSILTVSDIGNFAADGGIIGFFEQDRKIRFEINFEAAQTSKIKISSKLLKLAVIVRTRK